MKKGNDMLNFNVPNKAARKTYATHTTTNQTPAQYRTKKNLTFLRKRLRPFKFHDVRVSRTVQVQEKADERCVVVLSMAE
ncbi:hypothetical protein M378DRAFT_167372 [Amanita muscaria Koide BX008]|uniref:Uncharacterized protein n=1 Tax=Amanita muscaria (strain Koide BX008) TaxID=946122 RepID=A0A0C2SDG5_AMAMK|nr:hypothetical protein M378DRAFT_167372 [Amanita muscaria Koide BX008]